MVMVVTVTATGNHSFVDSIAGAAAALAAVAIWHSSRSRSTGARRSIRLAHVVPTLPPGTQRARRGLIPDTGNRAVHAGRRRGPTPNL